MDARLRHDDRPVSVALADVVNSLPDGRIAVRELIERIGDHGMLLLCALVSAPFLIPGIPFASIPFGLLIGLIGVGLMQNRIPWLPRFVLLAEARTDTLRRVLGRTQAIFERIEKLVHPRLYVLSAPGLMSRLNGAVLAVGGLLLALPLPVPGTNVPPAWGVLLLAIGMMQRDGALILAGWVVLGASVLALVAVGVAVWLGLDLHRWPTASQPVSP